MHDLIVYAIAIVGATINFSIGFYFGRLYGQNHEARAISPTSPHPAPSIARRMERIAKQAISQKEKPDIRVISPTKKRSQSLVDMEEAL